jgi:hypothetical protein
MPTLPVASMVILPLVDVESAVDVAVETSVWARAPAAKAVSKAAAAAESIKRCLINSASLKCRRAGHRQSRHVSPQGPLPDLGHLASPRECAPFFTLCQFAYVPGKGAWAVWQVPLYPAIVPVQQQNLPPERLPRTNLRILIRR